MVLVSCAQTRQIPRAWLFSKESIPGIIPRGLEGKQLPVYRDTLHIIYLEVKGTEAPVIDSIFYKGRLFSSAVHQVPPQEWKVGVKKASGDSLSIRPSGGNAVWKVELSPAATTIYKELQGKIMIIKGSLGNKPFTYSISSETELEPDIHV